MTISLREEQAEWIEEKSGDNGEYESKSDAIRTIIDRHQSLESEMNELQEENDRLQRERRQLMEQREEHTELVKYAQEHRSIEERRAEREERRARAGILTKTKWWLVGMDDSDD